MAKASQLMKGRRAIRRVPYPTCNAGHLLGGQPPELADTAQEAGVSAQQPMVGLRALTGVEWSEVLECASAFESDKTSERYELGRMVHALRLGCIDPDDPKQGLFFDGGAQQILASTDLGRDGIAYLYEQLEEWQDEVHPQVLRMDSHELDGAIAKLAGDEDSSRRFFSELRAGMRWSLARSMASLLLIFLSSKSGSGSESPAKRQSSGSSRKRPAKKARGKRR
jgi:hypothetical protein